MAKEWLTGPVMEQVMLVGSKLVEDNVIGVVVDMVNTIGQASQMKTAIRMYRLARQAKKSKEFQNETERLKKAKHQRDRLLRELEEVWSFLEDGMPGLETDQEPHSIKEGRTTTTFRSMNKKLDANMARGMVDLVLDQVAVEHNFQGSAACPA